MASFDFPASPNDNDTYSLNGVTYKYVAAKQRWEIVPTSHNFETTAQNESIVVYLGGLDTDIAQTAKAAIIPYLPYNLEVSELVLEVDVAPTGNDPGIEVDINVGETSFLTTVISIDRDETSSTTADVSYAINTTAFPNSRIPKGSKVTVDIDLVGATVTGQNLVLVINGVRY